VKVDKTGDWTQKNNANKLEDKRTNARTNESMRKNNANKQTNVKELLSIPYAYSELDLDRRADDVILRDCNRRVGVTTLRKLSRGILSICHPLGE